MKKVYIFDFDGTIIDSMDEFADIAQKVLNKHYGTPLKLARQQYIETSGLPFSEQVETLHPNDPRNKDATTEYETTKKKTYFAKKPFNDAETTLRSLNKKGIKTVVSSNNFQELVDEFIGQTSLKFDMVLGWRKNFAKGKDHFEYARKKIGCKNKDMIFVGDSLMDAKRAKDFGIDFIAKTGTFTSRDFNNHCGNNVTIIESLSELTNLST